MAGAGCIYIYMCNMYKVCGDDKRNALARRRIAYQSAAVVEKNESSPHHHAVPSLLAAGDATNPTANRIVINATAVPSELPTVNQMRLLPFVRILLFFIPPGYYCPGRRPLSS